MANISKNIKKLRTAVGITQQELADRLNVTRQAISSWENGKNQPDIQMLESLAKEFGVSLEEIIYGTRTQRNQRKLISHAVIWGVIFVAVLIVSVIAAPIIDDWTSTHYVAFPMLIYGCIIRPMVYVFAGIFGCSLISVFFPFYVKKKELKTLLTIVGIIVGVLVSFFAVIYFDVSNGRVLMWLTAVCEKIVWGVPAFFIIPGILLWLGIAKEPKAE